MPMTEVSGLNVEETRSGPGSFVHWTSCRLDTTGSSLARNGAIRHVVPWALLLPLVLTAAGCFVVQDRECAAFYDLDRQTQLVEFRSSSLERKYAMYRCALGREPPDLEFAGEFVDSGPEVVPFLLEKLMTEKRDVARMDVVFLFNLLAARGALCDERDAVNQVAAVVAQMKDPHYRKMSEDDLKAIEEHIRECP